MNKYNLPIRLLTYVEVEAENLNAAIDKAHLDSKFNMPGVDMRYISDFEVDEYETFEINDETLEDKDGAMFLSDIAPSKRHLY